MRQPSSLQTSKKIQPKKFLVYFFARDINFKIVIKILAAYFVLPHDFFYTMLKNTFLLIIYLWGGEVLHV